MEIFLRDGLLFTVNASQFWNERMPVLNTFRFGRLDNITFSTVFKAFDPISTFSNFSNPSRSSSGEIQSLQALSAKIRILIVDEREAKSVHSNLKTKNIHLNRQ